MVHLTVRYDTSLPEVGLYRFLSIVLVEDSKLNNVILHQSSGAGEFKRIR